MLIKLYAANGVGSHRLKVLPVSQMSQQTEKRKGERYLARGGRFDLKKALI